MEEDTVVSIDTKKINEEVVKDTIKEVYKTLEEKGYNATSQIVGYLLSGDLGYISSYKNARNKVANLDRAEVVEFLLNNLLRWDI